MENDTKRHLVNFRQFHFILKNESKLEKQFEKLMT